MSIATERPIEFVLNGDRNPGVRAESATQRAARIKSRLTCVDPRVRSAATDRRRELRDAWTTVVVRSGLEEPREPVVGRQSYPTPGAYLQER